MSSADNNRISKKAKELISKRVAVIGVGGGGSNTIVNLLDSVENLDSLGVTFYVLNTDLQALEAVGNKRLQKVLLGRRTTKFFGAGASPLRGYEAAIEDEEKIRNIIRGNDIVFVSMGLGGGTGSGVTPRILEIAKEMGILTVVFATYPWKFEGKQRHYNTQLSLNSMYDYCDSLVILKNDDLKKFDEKSKGGNDEQLDGNDEQQSSKIKELFKIGDRNFRFIVLSILTLLFERSNINIDFNDIVNVLSRSKLGYFFLTQVDVNDVTEKEIPVKVMKGIVNQFSHSVSFKNSDALLVNIGGNEKTLNIQHISPVMERIVKISDKDLSVMMGITFNDFIKPNVIQIIGLFTNVEYQDVKFEKVLKRYTLQGMYERMIADR